jgi:hypothetical protein
MLIINSGGRLGRFTPSTLLLCVRVKTHPLRTAVVAEARVHSYHWTFLSRMAIAATERRMVSPWEQTIRPIRSGVFSMLAKFYHGHKRVLLLKQVPSLSLVRARGVAIASQPAPEVSSAYRIGRSSDNRKLCPDQNMRRAIEKANVTPHAPET